MLKSKNRMRQDRTTNQTEKIIAEIAKALWDHYAK